MVSKSSVQHVVWEMFSLSIFESFISKLLSAKCVNNQESKLDENNVPKFGSMVTKYFSSHSQNVSLSSYGLACDQLWAYFLCQNYVPVF